MATAKATKAFTARLAARQTLPRALGCRPRHLGELSVSPFGFGCYRVSQGEPREEAFKHSLAKAIESGVNVIDTSASYLEGGSERLVGEVVEDVVNRGIAKREELVIVTKVGNLSNHDLTNPPPEAHEHREGRWHCIHPDYLQRSLDSSSERLKTTPDILLLHNPEFYLAGQMNKKVPLAEAEVEYYRRIQHAFSAMEDLVEKGRIGSSYGVSANLDGCIYSVSGRQNSYESTSLQRLVGCANEVKRGEAARFKVAQIPLNLMELGAAVGYMKEDGSVEYSLLRRAKAAGISIMGNRPLNAIAPKGVIVGDWGRNSESEFLRLVDSVPMSPVPAVLRRVLLEGFSGSVPQPEDNDPRATLAQLSLLTAASITNVDVVLCGARHPGYVEEMAKLLSWPAPEEESVWGVLDKLQDTMEEITRR